MVDFTQEIRKALAMVHHPRVQSDPNIMFGKPVIKGTRVTVEQILREFGSGLTPEEIIQQHPRLELDDVRAAEAFAADYLADDETAFG